MDTDALVEEQINAGQTFVNRLIEHGFDLSTAFWARTDDEARWFLYISSSVVDEKGIAAAYSDAYALLLTMPDSSISMSDIKLVGASHMIARRVLETQRQFAGARISWREEQIGGPAFQIGYTYSVHPTGGMSDQQVIAKVVELMQRSGAVGPSTISVKHAAGFHGIPIGLELNEGRMNVKFIDFDNNHLPRILPSDEILSIH